MENLNKYIMESVNKRWFKKYEKEFTNLWNATKEYEEWNDKDFSFKEFFDELYKLATQNGYDVKDVMGYIEDTCELEGADIFDLKYENSKKLAQDLFPEFVAAYKVD